MSNNKPYKLILQKDLNQSLIECDNLSTLTLTEDNIILNGAVSIGNSNYRLPITTPLAGDYLLTSNNSGQLSFTQSNVFNNTVITYYVSPLGSDTNNGSSVNQPFNTITHALSVINAISNNNKVVLTLLEGSYSENVNISRRNLYITSNNLSTTSTIINGNIVITIASNVSVDNSLIGFTLNGNLSFNDSGAGAFNYLCGNLNVNGSIVNNTAAVSNYSIVFNNLSSVASGNNNNLVSYGGRINLINANLSQDSASNTANMILINNGGLVLSNSIIISGNSTSSAPSIIKFNNSVSIPYSNSFINSQIAYTSATVNTGADLQKACINYNNSASLTLNSMLNCFLLCEGSRRNPSGSKYDCVIKTGASSVILTFGLSAAGATANHIDNGITHIAYVTIT